MRDKQPSSSLPPLLPAVKPALPLLPPLATNHLAFGSLPSCISSSVVWGQQLPVSMSQFVFHAGMLCSSPAWPIGPCPNSALPHRQLTARGLAKKRHQSLRVRACL